MTSLASCSAGPWVASRRTDTSFGGSDFPYIAVYISNIINSSII
jgi:hypothetical protein